MAQPPFTVRVLGAPRASAHDLLHWFLRASWAQALGAIVGGYLSLNALFGTAYWLVGGVSGLRPGVWRDAFYFSVQTMGTIGYGGMAPATDAAHLLVVAESVTGLVVTAVATGLVFTKFGRTVARVMFSRQAVIAGHNGVTTLMIRVGNERENRIADARFRLAMVRTEQLPEGGVFYRMIDLPLAREWTAALTRSFTLLHPITADSLLVGYDAARLAAEEVELHLFVTGVDDLTLQPVHATHVYADGDIQFGVRHRDILTEGADGVFTLNLDAFHDTEPA